MKNNPKTEESSAKDSTQLLKNLQEMVSQAEAMLKDTASNTAGETVSKVRDSLEGSQERLGELYSNAKTQCIDNAKQVDSSVRENPYQSMAIVAGVALLVGFLVRRKASCS